MIVIIDYGLGNVLAFVNTYRRLDIPVKVAKTAADLKDAHKIILPGVGAFDLAMNLFQQSGMREATEELVLGKGIPVIGICVGMQIMASSSEEGGQAGLNWVPGRVKRLNMGSAQAKMPLPHMGWNDVTPLKPSALFKGLEHDARFYFLHSYHYECDTLEHRLAITNYGLDFTSSVERGNVYGVQFHPEKSHRFGAQLLKNFAEL